MSNNGGSAKKMILVASLALVAVVSISQTARRYADPDGARATARAAYAPLIASAPFSPRPADGESGPTEEKVNEHLIKDLNADGTVPRARGGTELMREGLEARLPRIFLDTFSITASRVRDLPKGKRHILWLHDLPGDPENERLKYKTFRGQFDFIVFVSMWQKQKFQEYFRLDFHNSVVLRNAIRPFGNSDNQKSQEGPIRLIYHTTPHRGLEILIPAFKELYKKYGDRIHLDVYSSFGIYGWEHLDEQYSALFDQCREHPGCTYFGFVSNDEVREALKKAHIFAYPNIWSETSCLAVIEAMSAGCAIVTSQLAALPETLGGGRFGVTYPFTKDFAEHATSFLRGMDAVIQTYWDDERIRDRRQMSLFAAENYDWGFAGWSAGGRIEEWIKILVSRMPQFQTPPQRSDFDSDAMFSQALFVSAKRREIRGEGEAAREIYLTALEADPTSSLVTLALGSLEIFSGEEEMGIKRLEAVISPSSKFAPLPDEDSGVSYGIAIRASFYYVQNHFGDETRRSLDSAYISKYPHDDCWAIYRATYIPHVPMTEEEANENVAMFHRQVDELISQGDRLICDNVKNIADAFPIAYYDLDFRDELEKWTQLYMLAFKSSLALTAPTLHQDESFQQRSLGSISEKNPLRIGFISSFFLPKSSIWGSFGRTINHIQQNPMFQADLVYYPRSMISEVDKALSLNPETNLYLSPFSPHVSCPNRARARQDIVDRRYDILVYLDLFMTSEMNELAVAKLAPIQMVTHGHPVTSGIPSDIMDFFISWSAAELPDQEKAQGFYTEKLITLPGDKPWEYYEPRTKDGFSVVAGGNFDRYTRESLANEILSHHLEAAKFFRDPSSVLYFCSQAAFKLHFTFDKILADIQRQDANAVIVLVELKDKLAHIHSKMKRRLEDHHVDMSRVVFIPRMQHYHLMAMYQNADVVLDSTFFGGDTTTREAFETGAPIVTLPHKTIGQRWTAAYYKIMGMDDFIARDPQHYANLAVQVANLSSDAKTQLRERIKHLANEKLFRCSDGAQDWANMFLDIATRPRKWRWHDENLQSNDEL